jgi:hypothetical protein
MRILRRAGYPTLAVGLLALVSCGIALADTFDSSETLQIDFTVTAGPWNTLSIGFGSAATINSTGTVTFSLFDGGTLLGTDSTGLPFPGDRNQDVFSGVFVSSLTAFPQTDPTLIGNFTTIDDGTINGQVDITLSSGDIDNLDLAAAGTNLFNNLSILTWNLYNGGGGGDNASISSVELIPSSVPEPGSIALLLTVVLIIATTFVRRRATER